MEVFQNEGETRRASFSCWDKPKGKKIVRVLGWEFCRYLETIKLFLNLELVRKVIKLA
jgi:hypothetical protein